MRFQNLPLLGALVPTSVLKAAFVPSSLLVLAVSIPLGTGPNDFYQPGTQPLDLTDPILSAQSCAFCHAGYDPEDAPFDRWAGSMMANATRDPIFHAALAIAEQDAPYSGELCIRCHAPGGWLEGRSVPTDGSALFGQDYEGVSCQFCHRMVDPIADAANPPFDPGILSGLSDAPSSAHGGQYVVDPEDRRRGPFDPSTCNLYHPNTSQSPFHQESLLCATCHDVSNPAFTRVGGAVPSASDTYVLNALDTPHPNHDAFDQFPIERTYSEWLHSDFGRGPVDMGGLFGGNKELVSSCQDCHMPDTSGTGCDPNLGAPFRDDLPQHDFNGANSWVPLAIHSLDQSLELYGAAEASGQPLSVFQEAVDRNVSMLERASDTTLTQSGDTLTVRITNNGGHKLPTGYGEGRRMWIHVRFLDAGGALLLEHGHYDATDAELDESDTKVYEIKHGMDTTVADLTGNTPGESFHFVLNNTIEKDNRIPPRGFTNDAYEAIQAQPVGATYADGQYWDDTDFAIPCGAAQVEVTVYHQTTTKEYIEFLRDENTTNDTGQIAYDQWVLHGKSAPVAMDEVTLDLSPLLAADVASVSMSTGGTQRLDVCAGPDYASRPYWIIGSLSGTTPGVDFAGLHLPLNVDSWTLYTLAQPNVGPLVGTLGTLDAGGAATARLVLPADPSLIGLRGDHAAVVFANGRVAAISDAVGLDLVN